jgi:hypothetical protein
MYFRSTTLLCVYISLLSSDSSANEHKIPFRKLAIVINYSFH